MQSTKCPVSDFFGFRSLTVEICSARVMSRLSRQSPDFYKKGTVQCHLHFSSGESSTDRLVIMTIIMMMGNKIMIVLFFCLLYKHPSFSDSSVEVAAGAHQGGLQAAPGHQNQGGVNHQGNQGSSSSTLFTRLRRACSIL